MTIEPTIAIYTFYYKDTPLLNISPIYQPVMAGNSLHPTKMDIQGDDSGISISQKNYYYSELTGIYWAWKNQKQDIVGTCHYRRFYTAYPVPISHKIKRFFYLFAGLYRKRKGLIYTSNYRYWKDKLLTKEEIESLLDKFDAILPLHRTLKYSVEKHFSRYHRQEDLDLLRNVIKDLSPEYLPSFEQMLKRKEMFANNMFILRWNDFDRICEWLFSILFEVERRVDLSNYTGYQQRLMGFLAERLITTWIIHHQIKYKELELVYFKHLKKK